MFPLVSADVPTDLHSYPCFIHVVSSYILRMHPPETMLMYCLRLQQVEAAACARKAPCCCSCADLNEGGGPRQTSPANSSNVLLLQLVAPAAADDVAMIS
jgi:hypothetical protein